MEPNLGSENENLVTHFREALGLSKVEVRNYSALTLAYIGDAVYDLLIRTEVVCKCNHQVKKYHKEVSSVVRAEAQSDMIRALKDVLTEEEREVYHRGRNADVHSKAKNATMGDYKRATGFEALLGYLYLTEQYERITELILLGRERLEQKD